MCAGFLWSINCIEQVSLSTGCKKWVSGTGLVGGGGQMLQDPDISTGGDWLVKDKGG